MCQKCVGEGEMTAEELAARTAAGDRSVVEMINLEPVEFSQQLTALIIEAVMSGMEPEQAVDTALLVAALYVQTRGLGQEDIDRIKAELARI